MRFTIRDLLWLTVVVAMGVALGRERIAHLAFRHAMRSWWSWHLQEEHFTNPNDYKRLIEHEGPPFSN
jgi:hypothetical protein